MELFTERNNRVYKQDIGREEFSQGKDYWPLVFTMHFIGDQFSLMLKSSSKQFTKTYSENSFSWITNNRLISYFLVTGQIYSATFKILLCICDFWGKKSSDLKVQVCYFSPV